METSGKPKKFYVCDKCNYTTFRKSNYNNHLNRKTSCIKTVRNAPNVVLDAPNVVIAAPNVVLDEPNVVEPIVNRCFNEHTHSCLKCKKQFSSSYNLKKHSLICIGLDKLQCPICLKKFSNRSSKSKHIKNVKCIPIIQADEDENTASTTVIHNNNHTTNIINNNTVTNNNTTNNNTIIINFDNYTVEHLDKDKFKDKCRNALTCTKVIENYIKEVFFNPDCPENMNIKLTNLKPDYKFMDVYRDGWEKDLQSKILNIVIKHSLVLTKKILKEENESDDYLFVESDDDESFTKVIQDPLKQYDRNYLIDRKNFTNSLEQEAKKVLYNESVCYK